MDLDFMDTVLESKNKTPENFNQSWPKNKPVLVKHIKEWLQSKPERLPNFRSDGWHVSSLFYLCPRRHILESLEGTRDSMSECALQMRFELGHAIHDRLQNHILGPMGKLWGIWKCEKCGKQVRGYMPKRACDCTRSRCVAKGCIWPKENIEEMHCQLCPVYGAWVLIESGIHDKKTGIVGHYDGESGPTENDFIYEFKSIDPDLLTGKVAPDEGHVYQVRHYMKKAKKKYGLILYADKCARGKRIPFREFVVEQDLKASWLISKWKIKQIKKALERKRIPKRLPRGKDFIADVTRVPCKWCKWREECWNEAYLNQILKRHKGWKCS